MSPSLKSILIRAYPEIDLHKMISSFSRNQIAGLHEEGLKRGAKCGFMIKIDEMYCRLCRNKFRSVVRNEKINKWVFSEPI